MQATVTRRSALATTAAVAAAATVLGQRLAAADAAVKTKINH